MSKRKIAFVVQRYGIEVNGGSELLCRQLAEHIKDIYEIDVLTSCARDYITWKNFYPPGVERINGVRVRRFPTLIRRNPRLFGWFSHRMFNLPHLSIEEKLWMKFQGPYVPNLVRFITRMNDMYDLFIFFTYLYYPTYFGLPKVASKSILVPMAHDEPPIYFKIFKKFFTLPKAFIFNSEEEQKLVYRLFPCNKIPYSIGRIGLEKPEDPGNTSFQEKYGIKGDYLLYLGRIDIQKGCKTLIDYYSDYRKSNINAPQLVLVGEKKMKIPLKEGIFTPGYISEKDKNRAIRDCLALIIPSTMESLSIVALEAGLMGKPIIAPYNSKVLSAYIKRSRGGLLYKDKKEFLNILRRIHRDKSLRNSLGGSAKRYVNTYFTWERTIKNYSNIIDMILS